MKIWILCFCLMTLGLRAEDDKVETNKIVASVNGEVIRNDELKKAHDEALGIVSEEPVTVIDTLQNLVNRLITLQKAKKNKLDQDPIVKRRQENILFQEQLSRDLNPLYEKVVVTESDIQNYYKEKKEYDTDQILIRLKKYYTQEELDQTIEAVKDIYNKIKKDPSLFAQKAKDYSQIPNAKNGGKMGFLPAAVFAPEYYEAIHTKKAGFFTSDKKDVFITEPVKTQFGFHIIKVNGVKEYSQIDKKYYKDVIVRRHKQNLINKDYFANERKKASVIINQNNIDV